MVDKFTATRHELALESEPTCYFDAQKTFPVCTQLHRGSRDSIRSSTVFTLHRLRNHEDGFVPPGTSGCRTHTCEHTHADR